MCGIFGSTDTKTFRELYTKNSERGNFVRSVTMLFPAGMKNDIKVSTKYEQDFDKHIEENPFCIYYLGHVQSPTTEVRSFDTDTSHPFTYKDTYFQYVQRGYASDAKVQMKKLIEEETYVSLFEEGLIDEAFLSFPK